VLLTAAVGPTGLLGGQECDLYERLTATDAEAIARLDQAKTGVLIEAALAAGALVANADAATITALRVFGRHLGAAFQTLDDMIDAVGAVSTAQKDVGKDAGRVTAITLYGVDGARDRVLAHVESGCTHLTTASCGAEPLASFARASFAHVLQL
jgi:farnesyl diphosphate synthase